MTSVQTRTVSGATLSVFFILIISVVICTEGENKEEMGREKKSKGGNRQICFYILKTPVGFSCALSFSLVDVYFTQEIIAERQ